MREPQLYYRLKKQGAKPLVVRHVLRPFRKDKTLYIRVSDIGYYLVVFIVNKRVVGERVVQARVKYIRRKGRVYSYFYLRVPLPWYSVLPASNITITVYRLSSKLGAKAFSNYLASIRRY